MSSNDNKDDERVSKERVAEHLRELDEYNEMMESQLDQLIQSANHTSRLPLEGLFLPDFGVEPRPETPPQTVDALISANRRSPPATEDNDSRETEPMSGLDVVTDEVIQQVQQSISRRLGQPTATVTSAEVLTPPSDYVNPWDLQGTDGHELLTTNQRPSILFSDLSPELIDLVEDENSPIRSPVLTEEIPVTEPIRNTSVEYFSYEELIPALDYEEDPAANRPTEPSPPVISLPENEPDQTPPFMRPIESPIYISSEDEEIVWKGSDSDFVRLSMDEISLYWLEKPEIEDLKLKDPKAAEEQVRLQELYRQAFLRRVSEENTTPSETETVTPAEPQIKIVTNQISDDSTIANQESVVLSETPVVMTTTITQVIDPDYEELAPDMSPSPTIEDPKEMSEGITSPEVIEPETTDVEMQSIVEQQGEISFPNTTDVTPTVVVQTPELTNNNGVQSPPVVVNEQPKAFPTQHPISKTPKIFDVSKVMANMESPFPKKTPGDTKCYKDTNFPVIRSRRPPLLPTPRTPTPLVRPVLRPLTVPSSLTSPPQPTVNSPFPSHNVNSELLRRQFCELQRQKHFIEQPTPTAVTNRTSVEALLNLPSTSVNQQIQVSQTTVKNKKKRPISKKQKARKNRNARRNRKERAENRVSLLQHNLKRYENRTSRLLSEVQTIKELLQQRQQSDPQFTFGSQFRINSLPEIVELNQRRLNIAENWRISQQLMRPTNYNQVRHDFPPLTESQRRRAAEDMRKSLDSVLKNMKK